MISLTQKQDYYLLAVTINLLVLRIVIPYAEYLFIPLALFLFLYVSLRLIKSFSLSLEYLNPYKAYIPFILISLSFIVPLAYTGSFSILVLREAAAVCFFLFIIFAASLLLQTRQNLLKFLEVLLNQIYYIAIITAIAGLIKYLLHIFGVELSFLLKDGLYPFGSSLKLDHNFYTLPSIFCIIIILIRYKAEISRKKLLYYDIVLFILSLNILFSSSRRGLFILFAIIVMCWVILIVNPNLIKSRKIRKLFKAKTPIYYLVAISLFIVANIFIIFYTSPDFRMNTMLKLGIKTKIIRNDITDLVHEYSSIFGVSRNRNSFYEQLWKMEFDPKNPASGWGSEDYKAVKELSGSGYEIIPTNSIGYMLDKSTNYSIWENSVYSITRLADSLIQDDEILHSSIYCFVSKDFNGSDVRLKAGNKVIGDWIDYYDLNKKATWQKLVIRPHTQTAKSVPVTFEFSMKNAINLDSLKGHIVLAYPEYNKIKTKYTPKDPASGWGNRRYKSIYEISGHGSDSIPEGTIAYKIDSSSNASTWNGNAYSFTLIGNSYVGTRERVYATVYCFVSDDFNGSWVRLSSGGNTNGEKYDYYDLNKKETWQKLRISPECNNCKAPVYLYLAQNSKTNFKSMQGFVAFAYPIYQIIKDSTKLINNVDTITVANKDSYNYFLNGFYSLFDNIVEKVREYNVLSSLLQPDKEMDHDYNESLLDTRLIRWQFALKYYSENMSFIEKLFGSGFDYLKEYGARFWNDDKHLDYPHNTIISALLYSGFVGAALYVFFLIHSLLLYFRFRKDLAAFFLFYIITFSFVLFSSNSHFELPLFTFLSLVPYIYLYTFKAKENKPD